METKPVHFKNISREESYGYDRKTLDCPEKASEAPRIRRFLTIPEAFQILFRTFRTEPRGARAQAGLSGARRTRSGTLSTAAPERARRLASSGDRA